MLKWRSVACKASKNKLQEFVLPLAPPQQENMPSSSPGRETGLGKDPATVGSKIGHMVTSKRFYY